MIERDHLFNWIKSQDYLKELSEYLALPSRSARKEEVKISGDYAIKMLESAGLEVQRIPTAGNDVIFGQSIAGPDYPTILIYGHADVQPEGDLDKWDTPPFEATKIGDKLFGRGTADNKGQHYAHILSLRYLREFQPDVFNKVNIKFILDGDEELGSFGLPDMVRANKKLLEADFLFVADGPSLVMDAPTIVGGVRGIVSFQISIVHNESDLHSGNFGGVARSATFDMIKLINSMINDNGKSLIPGFYDDVDDLTPLEKDAMNNLEPVYSQIMKDNGITPSVRPEGHSHQFLNEAWPTFNVNGLGAGGVNDDRRTIIPSEAYASIDCRLVYNQSPEKMVKLLSDHIDKWKKENNLGNSVKVEFEGTMMPSASSLNSEYLKLFQEAAEQAFQVKPVLVPRLGGSLPIQLFNEILGIPVFLLPYALPDERNHSPNENLDLPYFEKGVMTTVYLLSNMIK